MQRLTVFLTRVALVAAAVPSFAQTTVETGFEATDTLAVPVFVVQTTLADGRTFQFDGTSFELYAANGGLLQNLGALPAFAFPSFAVLDPTETFALVGESTAGDLLRVDLAGGGFQVVANLPFNYDGVFDVDPAFALVSAVDIAPFGRNRILRVQLDNGAVTLVAKVIGFSGPIALDSVGDLYYATQDTAFPPTPGSTDVLRWTRAQVDGASVLNEGDATVFSADFDGGSSMAFDPVSEHLFLVETNSSGAIDDAIHEIDADGQRVRVVATSPNSLGFVEFVDGGGTGSFQAFQPANVRMKVTWTDFNVFVAERLTIEPRRPLLEITGGLAGAVSKTVTITGAVPDAAVSLYFGSVADAHFGEILLPLFGFPFHSVLELMDIRRTAFFTPTDSSGTATFHYFDPGTLHGTLVFQALLLDENAEPVGTSSFELN